MRTKVRLDIEQSPRTCPANPLVGAHPPPRGMQYGVTAINLAAYNKRWDTVRLLLERKADPNIADSVRLIMACLTIAVSVLGLKLGVRVRLRVMVSVGISVRVTGWF